MNKDEALQLALGALQNNDGWGSSVREQKERAITAIKEALETKDEPVAYMGVDCDGNPNKFRLNPFNNGVPLYRKTK